MDAGRATPEQLLAHAGWVRRLARSLVADAATADDVAQEAWIAALKRPPAVDRPLQPWLARVVANTARNAWRSEGRRRARETTRSVEQHEVPAADAAAALEMQRLLLDAVERLREPLRATLVRAYFHERSSADIAAEDGITESTVRGRLKQAIDALRRELDVRHDGDRRAWVALLVPLAPQTESTATTTITAASAATIGTVIGMSILAKSGIAAAVVIAAAVWLWNTEQPEVLPALEPGSEVARTESLAEPAGGAREQADVPEPPAVSEVVADAVAISASPITPALPATVEARLVDARGSPVQGGTLTCVDRLKLGEIERSAAPSATADADGVVRLELVSSDVSKNRSRKQHMAEDSWQAILEAQGPATTIEPIHIDVRTGRVTLLGTVVLADAGDVQGRVVDEAGQGLTDVGVHFVLPELTLEERDDVATKGLHEKQQQAWARTAADGTFSVRIQTGFYRAWTQAEGRFAAMTEPFEVRVGETTHLPDLRAAENRNAVRGIVLGVDGKPTRAHVEFLLYEPTIGDVWVGARSEEDGTFFVESFPTPTIDLYAERVARKDDAGGTALLRGVPAGSRNVVLQLRPTKVIDLTVRGPDDQPISAYNLGVLDLAGNGTSILNAHPEHHMVPALGKPFRLHIKASGFYDEVLGPYEPDNVPAQLVVKLRPTARVTGRVVAEGVPVPNASVSAHRLVAPDDATTVNGFPARFEEVSGPQSATGPDGSFTLAFPTAGRFVLIARKQGHASTESAEMELGPTQGIEGLELTLIPGGALAGHVRGPDLDAARVRFVTVSRGRGTDISAPIEADGSYRTDHLTPGAWLVRATEEDHSSMYRSSRIGPSDFRNRTVVIEAGRTTSFDVEALAQIQFAIEGHLVLQGVDLRTWAASAMHASPHASYWITSSLQAAGRFDLALDHAGRHRLRIRSAASDVRSDTIEVELDVGPGTTKWSLDVHTGSIALTSAPTGELELSTLLEGGARWTTRVRPPPSGELRIDHLPVGSLEIRSAGQAPRVVEVTADGVTSVVWN